MGTFLDKIRKITKKQKSSKYFALAAAVAANPSSFIAENWWNEAVNVFNFSNENWEQFASAVDSIDDSQWQPLWGFCNADGDSEITGEELTNCAAAAAEYVGMSEATQSFLYDFGVKSWDTVDQDGSGGLVEGDELTNWKNFVKGQLAENGWNPSEDSLNGMKAAWANAQVDGDDNSASMLELARFVVGAWNVLLQ